MSIINKFREKVITGFSSANPWPTRLICLKSECPGRSRPVANSSLAVKGICKIAAASRPPDTQCSGSHHSNSSDPTQAKAPTIMPPIYSVPTNPSAVKKVVSEWRICLRIARRMNAVVRFDPVSEEERSAWRKKEELAYQVGELTKRFHKEKMRANSMKIPAKKPTNPSKKTRPVILDPAECGKEDNKEEWQKIEEDEEFARNRVMVRIPYAARHSAARSTPGQ